MQFKNYRIFIAITLMTFQLYSCNGHRQRKGDIGDTAKRISTDTVLIPGSPGPSGTEPRPIDTTRAHRDSLKKLSDISDTDNLHPVKR